MGGAVPLVVALVLPGPQLALHLCCTAAESLWLLPSKTIGEDTKEEATVSGKNSC